MIILVCRDAAFGRYQPKLASIRVLQGCIKEPRTVKNLSGCLTIKQSGLIEVLPSAIDSPVRISRTSSKFQAHDVGLATVLTLHPLITGFDAVSSSPSS